MTNKKYIRNGKRKEIVFREKDWRIIEQKAAAVKLDTTKYITRAAVHGTSKAVDFKELSKLFCELNKIGNNINQLARKANENLSSQDMRTSFRQSFAADCVKKPCHTRVCLRLFALSSAKSFQKSAHISYEDRF